MTTGYVALYTLGGDGLGIASAATDVSLANRNLALGTGSLTATNLTGTLQTASQPNVTTLASCSRIAGSVANFSFGGVGSAGRSITMEMPLAVASGVGSVEGLYVGGALGSSSGTLTSETQLQVSPLFTGNVGTITSAYGLFILSGGSTGTITTGYGLRVMTPAFGTSRVCAQFDGVVGVGGVPSSASVLHLLGTWTTTSAGFQYGLVVSATMNPAGGAAGYVRAIGCQASFVAPSSTTVVAAAGLYVSNTASSNVGTITDLYGIHVDTGSAVAGTVTRAYGLYVRAPAHGSTKYTAYFDGGVGVGAANATTNNFALRSTTVHLGDGYDNSVYGQLQITRPASQGTAFHQTFVRSGVAVFGIGFLDNSSTFGLISSTINSSSTGIFINTSGWVGVGIRAPFSSLHAYAGSTATSWVSGTTINEDTVFLLQRPANAATSAGRSPVGISFKADAYSSAGDPYGWNLAPAADIAKIIATPLSYLETSSFNAGYHGRLDFFVYSSGHSFMQSRMSIRGDGNVSIGGTTAVNNRLEVVGGGLRVQGASSTTNSGAGIELSYSGTTGIIRSYNRASSAFGPMQLYGSSTGIVSDSLDMTFLVQGAQPINFYTSNLLQMQINASGHLVPMTVSIDLGTTGNRFRDVWCTRAAFNGSDERIKTQIQPSRLGLDFVRKLKPMSWQWKDTSGDDTALHHGFIAQQVKQVLTEVGATNQDFGGYHDPEDRKQSGFLALAYNEFIAPVVSAVQELDRRIEAVATPILPTSEGQPGCQRYSDGWLYICVAPNQWNRLPLQTDWA